MAFANVLITGSGLMYHSLAGAEAHGVRIVNGIWIVSLLVSNDTYVGWAWHRNFGW
jgi:hypothetical protein